MKQVTESMDKSFSFVALNRARVPEEEDSSMKRDLYCGVPDESDSKKLDINQISAPASHDLEQVNTLIRKKLSSRLPFINQISRHIIDSGGKKIRPLVAVLVAKACGYNSTSHVKLGAIVEFIHTATLLHDDVVDNSDTRRGKPTALRLWGSSASVLVGDFLYSRAFEMIADLDHPEITRILAKTTNTIAEGEVHQLMYVGRADVSEEVYMHIISRKAAELFAAAARIGAVISGVPKAMQESLATYGFELGLSFQIIDDVLDYQGNQRMGKEPGDDLAESKVTLPLIHALKHCTKAKRTEIEKIVRAGDRNRLQEILDLFHTHGSLVFAQNKAEEIAKHALSRLQNVTASAYRESLEKLPVFVCTRNH